MSSLHDHSPGGDLLFAGEVSGVQFRLSSLALHNNDEEDKPDVPEGDVHGNWLHVSSEKHDEAYLQAVGELIAELQRLGAEEGDEFEITRCKKSGPSQTDPYEVNLEEVDPDQSRL